MIKVSGAIAGLATLLLSATSANAATFIFKGEGATDFPGGVAGPSAPNNSENCTGNDLCTIDASLGFTYSDNGVTVTATAFSNGSPTTLIQDLNPSNSGLGAFSTGEDFSDDQIQFDSGESLEFDFGTATEWTVTDVEFNAGGDVDCTNFAARGEGPCGSFRLQIFDMNGIETLNAVRDITNVDLLPLLGTGSRFVLTALTPGAGFTVAAFNVSEVPVPAALPLLISGIAGLGFASRRRKSA